VTPPIQALLFPGQGSQKVGMGAALAREFPEAADVFREADDILPFPLSRLMWEGPETKLVLTRNAQPALFVHSLAVLRVARARIGPVDMAAGHSLGEFSAHVAAGTLSFRDALEAVRLRGELMHQAGRIRPGAMAAVLGMEDEAVESMCSDVSAGNGGVVVPANFNSAGQVVISGDTEAVATAAIVAPDRGARKVVPLAVSGAFHSPLMAPAESGLEAHLANVPFADPEFPVYSNVSGGPVTTGDAARELLVRQLTSPVRWSAEISNMVQAGVTRFIELGPGSVLAGLNRRNARGIDTISLGEPDDLAALD